MKPERWNKIESIFHKAVEAGEDRRGAVLEESCAGDEDLRREVESLLARHESAGSFIETPAFEADSGTVQKRRIPWSAKLRSNLAGRIFGRYRIEEEIGAGGMGVVYKAWDSKMEGWVALKFLPSELAADRHAVERLGREARAAFALNHPNICTIYDIVEEQGSVFIAMEFLEGQTLAGYMGGRALPADRITKLGMPLAEALGAAHAKGVVHRDIKPGNIFVTTSGLVKVLDFGVAKLLQTPGDPAATVSLTKTDGVSGTLPYMSPEQLREQDVDARSDIYSLGIVLYEMSAGRRPYPGNQQSELIDAILNLPAPPPRNINPQLPIKLEEIILKCLEKDPEDRYQTVREIAVDLRRMGATSGTTKPAVTSKAKRKRWVWLSAAAGVVGLGLAAWGFWPVTPPRVTGSTQITHDGVEKCCMVTDGSRIYFDQILNGSPVLTQVSAAGGETSPIATTVRDPWILDISPNHSELLVRAGDGDTPFWILPLPAGSPRRLGSLIGEQARWSPDGSQLVFTNAGDLHLTKADGTEALLLKSGRASHPSFSPDGRRVRFTTTWPGTLWEINTDGSNLHQVLPGWHNTADRCCGLWTPDGSYYVFWSDALSGGDWGDFFALRESRGFRRASAAPVQVTFGPSRFDFRMLLPSADGRKLFVQGRQSHSELVRYDEGSKQFVPFLPGLSATWAAFSRDGKWIAYTSIPDGTLWRSRVDGSERLQLTFAHSATATPNWSPDGRRIAYTDQLPGKAQKVFLIPAQGGSPEELLPEDVEEGDPTWSADGTQLAFGRDSHGKNPDIQIVDMKTRQALTLSGSKGLFSPRWSPNGRYLAVETADIKKLVLYDFRTQKWSDWVTEPDRLAFPSWSGDSRYVYYYLNTDHPICRRAAVGASHPENLFSLRGLQRYDGWAGLAPDDSRLFSRDSSIKDIYALDVDFP